MGFLSRIFGSVAKNWFYEKLEANQTPQDSEEKTLEPNQEYLHIFLKSMRIVNVRKGLSKFYATVHSHIEVPHISGKNSSFNYVTTPGNLEKLDSKRIDKVININRRLLGPVPYRGSDVKIEVGLFSIKEDNLAEPFIKLLTSMSGLGGVAFISAALPYVQPLEDGIELLTGSQDKTILEIGLNMEMNVVKTGYYVVMRAERKDIDSKNLRIAENDFRLIDIEGNTIEDYPYMVLQIYSSKNREDWFNVPEVAAAHKKLQEDVQKGNYNDATESLKIFKRITYTNSDLLYQDGKLIYEKVEKDTNEILKSIQTAKPMTVFKLKDLSEFTLQ